MNPSSPNQPYNGGMPPVGPQSMPPGYPENMQQPGYPQNMPQNMPPVGPQSMPPGYPENMQPNQQFAAPPQQPAPAQPMPQQPSGGVAPMIDGTPSAPRPMAAKGSNPNSTQNTLQIAEIRDGIVIMSDGSFRAVIMTKAINFDLMSQDEQEAVEYSYQGFLNSLYFPVQIFVHSQLIDLKPYITKLDRLRAEHDNMLLSMLIDDYINYIDALSQQANIMDKEFYVVIPYFPHVDTQKALAQSKNFFSGLVGLFNTKDQHVVINEIDLENAKSELRNRVQATLSGLLQCGVQGLPLDTQELIELYYNVYNPDTATYQQLKDFDTMTADVISKGPGPASQAHLQGELQQ